MWRRGAAALGWGTLIAAATVDKKRSRSADVCITCRFVQAGRAVPAESGRRPTGRSRPGAHDRDRLSVAGVRGLREEGLEVIADERVEHALVRCPRSVRDGRRGHLTGRRRDCADLNLREKRRVCSPRCQVLPRSADSPTARKPNLSGPLPARTAIRSPAGVSLHEGSTGRLGATSVIVNSEAVLFRTLAAVV